MDRLIEGLTSMGSVGVFIGLALGGLFAWVYSGEKKKADAAAEKARKKAWEELQAWERAHDEIHTLPHEEGK
jgi:flagellar basal body-associated protein FliL